MATSRSFIFNLLTPKSEEEIEKEEQRDDSSVYTAILPLVGALVWVGVVLVNSLIVQGYVTNLQKKITNQNTEVASFDSIKKQNGELFLKAKALSGVIEQNIDPDEFFQVVEGTLFSVSPDITINSYGRQENGKFDINASSDSFIEVAKAMNAFTSNSSYKNVKLNSASLDTKTGVVNFRLELEFIGKE